VLFGYETVKEFEPIINDIILPIIPLI